MNGVISLRSGERPLRIALLAPPMVPVPPIGYGGTERVVAALEADLVRRGHQVTTFASGDSDVSGELVPVLEQSLWATGYNGDVANFVNLAIARCWAEADRFDVIHSHTETMGFLFARYSLTPVVSTLHGRLDNSGIGELLDEFRDIALVAISENQKRWWPENDWRGVVHHGLPLAQMPSSSKPGDYMVLVGRISPEKGVAEAVELQRLVDIPLKVAAKVHDPTEEAYFAEVLEPALGEGVEFLGELEPVKRDPLLAGAFVTVMLGSWPEPFGLTAIESLGTGTPVIARKVGALPEIVEHGVDGFLVDDLAEAAHAIALVPTLSRERIRERALERFSPERMADEYEAIYRALIAERREQSAERRTAVTERRGPVTERRAPGTERASERASEPRPVGAASAAATGSAAGSGSGRDA